MKPWLALLTLLCAAGAQAEAPRPEKGRLLAPTSEFHTAILPGLPPGAPVAEADDGDGVREPSRTVAMEQDFEGSFPAGDWFVRRHPDTPYTWDDDNARPHGGSWAAWCADQAFDGAPDLDPETDEYVNDMESWAIYGPFSLADADAAVVDFSYWNESESGYDYFGWYASINGTSFSGTRISGNTGDWVRHSFDLSDVPTLGDLRGQDEVWIGFRFVSDGSVTYEGAWIDDVTLETTSGAPDIVIDDIWTDPAQPIAGQDTDFYVTFRNQGDAPAVDITLDYYADGAWVDDDSHGELLPGESRTELETNYVFASSGAHVVRVEVAGVAGESNVDNNAWQRTVQVQPGRGDIEVFLRDENGSPVGSSYPIVRYDGSWNFIDDEDTDSGGSALWSDIVEGVYRFEAYDDARTAIWNSSSYWSGSGAVTLGVNGSVDVVLERDWPYVAEILVDPVQQTSQTVHVDVRVANPHAATRSVRCRIVADRSQDGGWDFASGAHGPLSLPGNGSVWFGFDWTLPGWDHDTICWLAAQVESDLGSWTQTDGTGWIQAFSVFDPGPPELAILAPVDGAGLAQSTTVRVDGEDYAGRALDRVRYYIDGGLAFTDDSPDGSSPASTWSWNTETVGNGAHEIRVVGRDDDGRESESAVDVAVWNLSDVGIAVRDANQQGTGTGLRVDRFDDQYGWMDSDATNSAGTAQWSQLPAGAWYGWRFEAYDERLEDRWGGAAYWGNTELLSFPSQVSTVAWLDREEPRALALFTSENEAAPGETLPVICQVGNDGPVERQVRVRVVADRDRSAPWDELSSPGGSTIVPAGGTDYAAVQWTFPEGAANGEVYWLGAQVQSWINGSWQATDNGDWMWSLICVRPFQVDAVQLSVEPAGVALGDPVVATATGTGQGNGFVDYRWRWTGPSGSETVWPTVFQAGMVGGVVEFAPFAGLPTGALGTWQARLEVLEPNSFLSPPCEYVVGREIEALRPGDAAWLWQEWVPADAGQRLDAAGVETVFLRLGHFRSGTSGRFTPFGFDEDDFARLPNQQIHGAFSFGWDFNEELEQDPASAIDDIVAGIESVVEPDGVPFERIAGVQLDLEGISVALYDQVAAAVQQRFAGRLLISMSPQIWMMGDSGYPQLEARMDFVVPMFYDYGWANAIGDNFEVTDPGWITQQVQVAAAQNKPFFAGIPTYSYVKIYGADGLVASEDDHWANAITLDIASEDPRLQWLSETMNTRTSPPDPLSYSGDNVCVFRVLEDCSIQGRALEAGGWLRTDSAGGRALARCREAVLAVDDPLVLGSSMFRFGTADDVMLDEGLNGVEHAVRPRLELEAEWMGDGIWELSLRLENDGDEPSRCFPWAAGAHLRWPGGSLGFLDDGGDFAELAGYRIESGAVVACALADAEFAELGEMRLGVDETLLAGPWRVVCDGPLEIDARAWAWSFDDPVGQSGQANLWYHAFAGHDRLETRVIRDPEDPSVVNDEWDGTPAVLDYAVRRFEFQPPLVAPQLECGVRGDDLWLAWEPVSGADGYQIHRSPDARFEPARETLIGESDSPGFVDRDRSRSAWFYRVVALRRTVVTD